MRLVARASCEIARQCYVASNLDTLLGIVLCDTLFHIALMCHRLLGTVGARIVQLITLAGEELIDEVLLAQQSCVPCKVVKIRSSLIDVE